MGPHTTASHSNTQNKTKLNLIAEKLHKNRIIYLLFGLIDGLSNTSSMISYFSQVLNPTDSSFENQNRIRLWLLSPLGIAMTVLEASILTVFSMLGSYFKDAEDGSFKSLLARTWPYVRDSVKAIKNAYKSLRSVLFIAVVFGASAAALSGIFLPLGISLGMTYILTRIWNRYMVSERKGQQLLNQALAKWPTCKPSERDKLVKNNPMLKNILEHTKKTTEDQLEYKEVKDYIKTQSRQEKIKAYALASFNELINGLYLYAGVYLLCALTPTIAIALSVFALFYGILSIARGLYEERTYQEKLTLSQIKAQLAYPEALSDQERTTLSEQKEKLESLGYGTAFGEALRNGLNMYSALTGCLFATSLFVPIPLLVVLVTVCLGVISLLGFALHHVWYTRKHLNEKIPDNPIPDAFEVFRSLGSGIKQGQKVSLSLILNAVRESKPAMVIGAICSAFAGAIYTLKALAKGFGRAEKTHHQENPILLPVDSIARIDSSSSQEDANERPPLAPYQGSSPLSDIVQDSEPGRCTSSVAGIQ